MKSGCYGGIPTTATLLVERGIVRHVYLGSSLPFSASSARGKLVASGTDSVGCDVVPIKALAEMGLECY